MWARPAAVFAVFTLLAASPALAAYPYPAAVPPHPAVARIIVPERTATSYGTGTLVDVREQYGLVITNWHVVRDGIAPPEVVFPSGFRSRARTLKLDSHWDLAALVIWRPPIEPVPISRDPPRPGESLTICGYGQGNYRAVTGRCTQYFAPRPDYPHELVELDVEARQGDSGGPIFNDRGELAGVLFGAGRGTTMGSYGGRVHSFLASLAPGIGDPTQPEGPPPQQLASLLPPQQVVSSAVAPQPSPPADLPLASSNPADIVHEPQPVATIARLAPIEPAEPAGQVLHRQHEEPTRPPADWLTSSDAPGTGGSPFAPASPSRSPLASLPAVTPPGEPLSLWELTGGTLKQQLTTLLTVFAVLAVVLQLAKWTGR